MNGELEARSVEVEDDGNDVALKPGIPRHETTGFCAYSSEVNAMRQARDQFLFLRRSEVGFSFFDRLFFDYYGFSPEVCRLMVVSPELRERVEKQLVRPLTLVLGLIHDYTLGQADAEELGRLFEAGLAASPELESMSREEVWEAVNVLRGARRGGPLADPVLLEISRVLGERAMASPPVRWALMDTVAIYADALLWRHAGTDPSGIGRLLAASFNEWAPEMPLIPVWRNLGKDEIRQELAFLKRCLLRTPKALQEFGQRLVAEFPDDPRLPDLLVEAGYFSAGRPHER
jgi:hypothetical protein